MPKQLQILNTYYQRPANGQADYILIVYRDLKTKEKKFKIITQPKFSFFITKPDISIPHHLSFIQEDQLEKVQCEYRNLYRTIAQLAGMEDEFKRIIRNRQNIAANLKKFQTIPYIFQSDMDIEDYYKGLWIKKYPIEKPYLTKGYFDIEVDSIDIDGFPEPNEAKCPINVITFIYDETNEIFTFALRNPKNPQIEKFENRIKEFKKEILAEYKEEGIKGFNITFYDDELELIKACFAKINETKPDICCAWNISFDIVTIENRITRLGGNKNDIICPKEIPPEIRNCYFVKDYRHQKFADSGDYYQNTGWTYYACQMRLYAALRKANGELDDSSLQKIAEIEKIGMGKIDYKEETNIKEFPYDNYAKFIKYNIRDVICQYLIEKKCEDFNQLFMLAYNTKTRIHKVLRKTISLKNLYSHFCNDMGLVLGNNINIYNQDNQIIEEEEDEDEKVSDFLGGFVADPNLNGPNGIKILTDKSRFVFEDCIDEDATSLYPSIIMLNNIEASTQVGRYIIGEEAPNKEYDPGGEFIDNYQAKDWLNLGIDYFNLPTIAELVEDIENGDK